MRQSIKNPVCGATILGVILFSGISYAQDGYPMIENITPVSAKGLGLAPLAIPQDLMQLATVTPPTDTPILGLDQNLGPLGLPCDTNMTASPAAGGTVQLRIEAPCLPSARIRISHQGLAADYFSSSSGIIETVFPAFTVSAKFEASLPSGQVLSVIADIPEAEGYEHMASMWQGTEGLTVHAFEFGAAQGQNGHVWNGAARIPEVADSGRGGFLLSLGTGNWSDGAKAEVYSFPVSESVQKGSVRIALGASVTPRTCGQEIQATTLQIGDGLPGVPVDISLQLPDCSSNKDFILLKNLARDLRIASN